MTKVTQASGVFSGGSVTAPIKISSTADEKIIIEKSSNPYIRFREGTTNKGYIQWHSNGRMYIGNYEHGSSIQMGDRFEINTKHGYMHIGSLN